MKKIDNIRRKHRLALLIFVLLPTIVVAAYLLWQANSFFSILRNQWPLQLLYFGTGLFIGNLVYSGRLRFVTSFIILLLSFFLIYRFLDNLSLGEFDAFFISKQFLVFAILFAFGVFIGWGLLRYSFFAIIVACFFFLLAIYLLSKTGEFTIEKISYVLLPIIFYCVYLIFTSNELARFKETKQFSWSVLNRRLFIFLIFVLLVGTTVVALMKVQIKETIERYGGTPDDANSMLKKNKDGSIQNDDKMGLTQSNKRSNDLVFCAYIDNFFEGTTYPNPLYLTSFYFTKFDTLTETFERDPAMPFKDEFTPIPDEIPLFSKVIDKTVLDSAIGDQFMHEVNIELYKKKLSADAFLAPSTAYEVQPITVEKDFQDDYLYAYRAKSLVSKLNSAYFIYNSDDPMIATFQEERFKQLRNVASYDRLDKRFFDYYTFFPSGRKYQNFKQLADSLNKSNKNTIDKILAIRDYFKQKNPLGEAVYTYSDNPGIPGLPGASKLSTFMFETKKAWCTFYAGSSLLLLRAMKIPSRIAVGFMTVDRSDNNKGWYWFYQDQAHAWVQVYFPDYGWLDFDFTTGNDEAQQSPAPDQTPPLQPPKAVVVASGTINSTDTLKSIATIQAEHFIYKENEFKKANRLVSFDLSKSKIWKDSVSIKLAELQVNDYIVGVSYDIKLVKYSGQHLDDIIKNLPSPIPVDEVYLKTKKDPKENIAAENNRRIRVPFLAQVLFPLIMLILFIFFLPAILLKVYAYRFKRSKNVQQRAYRLFRYTTYYLNQLGFYQQNATLNEFAAQQVQPTLDNQYHFFTVVYQRIKFANVESSKNDDEFLQHYFSTFTQNIKDKIKWTKRFQHFLKLNRTLNYLISYQNN